MPSYALNNFTAPDAYLAPGQTAVNGAGQACGPATLQFLPVLDHVNLNVLNAAVFYSLMQTDELSSPDTGRWYPEVFAPQGFYVIQRAYLVGIRVRAAVTATALATGAVQAQVTVEAVER